MLEILILVLIVVAFLFAYLWYRNSRNNIVTFIVENPNSASIIMVKNNSVLIDRNSTNLMPLASVVKVIIVIEFAQQAAKKTIDASERIQLSELEKFYIRETDGGSHQSWLRSIPKGNNGSVSLSDVARGMIEYSSNANAEFLMGILGFDNVNNALAMIGLEKHEPIYPFVSSLIVLRDLSLFDLKRLTKHQYIKLSYDVHQKLKNNSIDKSFTKEQMLLKKQEHYENWFIRGTAEEYVSILSKINSRKFFSMKEQKYIERIMKHPFLPSNLSHGGEKTGSLSAGVLTQATYETTTDGDKFELVIFLRNLSKLQQFIFSFSLVKLKYDLLANKNAEKYMTLFES